MDLRRDAGSQRNLIELGMEQGAKSKEGRREWINPNRNFYFL